MEQTASTENIKYVKPETVLDYFSKDLDKTVGINWRRLRNEKDMSISEFCNRSGINQSIVSDIEACTHKSVSMDVCCRAANAYGMDISDFMHEITKGVSTEDPLPYKDITTADLIDVYPYNLISLIKGEVPDPVNINLRGFNEALDSLFEKERTVLLLRYKFNKSLREAGQELGVSKEGARRIEARALRKLRCSVWVKAMSNPSFIGSIRLFEDTPDSFIVLEKDYVVNIIYKDLLDEFTYGPNTPVTTLAAQKALSRSTSLVFSNFVLLRDQKPEDYAKSYEYLAEENRKRIDIVNMVCDGDYIGAFHALRSWLSDKDPLGYMSYDEAQFLSMLHVILNGSITSKTKPHCTETVALEDISRVYDAAVDDSVNMDIDQLQISKRTLSILKRLRCNDTDDIARIGRRDFMLTRGCGEKSLFEISEQMKKCGYDW